MERKNRIWLIVLIVLLIAALSGMIFFRSEWKKSEKNLSEEALASETLKNSLETLQAEADQLRSDLEKRDVQSQPETVETPIPTQTPDAETASPSPTMAAEDQTARVTELEESRSEVVNLVNAVADAAVNVASLQTELQQAQFEVTALTSDAQTDAETIAAAQAVLESKQAELEQAVAEKNALLSDLVERYAIDLSELTAVQTAASAEALNERVSAVMADTSLTDEEKRAQIEEMQKELAANIAALTEASETLKTQAQTLSEETQTDDSRSQMESDLNSAELSVATLQAIVEADEARIAELETQIANMGAEDASALSELQAQLALLQSELDAKIAELAAARTNYEQRLAELEAYLLSRALSDGEAHTSTMASNVINVAADGVTCEWQYTNQTISGNAVVLSIVMDDAELYRSEAIQPGESIETLRLNEVLKAGQYSAMAVTAIYDADGGEMFVQRVPVTLDVAE